MDILNHLAGIRPKHQIVFSFRERRCLQHLRPLGKEHFILWSCINKPLKFHTAAQKHTKWYQDSEKGRGLPHLRPLRQNISFFGAHSHRAIAKAKMFFIIGRNEVVAKVIFLHLSVILFTGGGVSASVHAGIPPPRADTPLAADTPRADTHTPEQTPPPGKQTSAYGQ